MPSTRADLERLKHHWETGRVSNYGEHVDELLAMAERLLTERDEAVRIGGRNWEVAREHDHRSRNLHAELLERCETMERMAREPLWLTVASGNPMIHFVSDPRWIWSCVDETTNEGETE